MNVTEKQKKMLLQYLKENEDFARGRLRYNSQNKSKLDDMWTTISTSLNSIGSGPQKEMKEWQKTWRDWKSNVLKKCAKHRSYVNGTGGGPPAILKLTELEEEMMTIINPEAAGLCDIPEGGNFDRGVREERTPHANLKRPHDGVLQMGQTKRHDSFFDQNLSGVSHVSVIIDEGVPSTSNDRDDEAFDFDNENAYENEKENRNGNGKENENYNENVDPCGRSLGNRVSSHPAQRSNSKRRDGNAGAAVNLMSEDLAIKKETLQVAKDTLNLEKEKFEFAKKQSAAFIHVLNEMNNNLTVIKDGMEKMAPTYLDETLL